MEREVISNAYADGKRVSMQKVTFEKSDDLFTLANLQRQLENIEKHIAASGNVDVSALTAEKERIEAEISIQQAIVDGYEEQNEENV